MTEMTVHIEGLAELRDRFGNTAILRTELKTAERAGLTEIRDHAKYNAALFSNKLPQSVQLEVRGQGLEGIVHSLAKTAASIERGRAIGERVSYEAIENWLKQRGRVLSISTRRVVKRSRSKLSRFYASQEDREIHDEAVQITRMIRERGTRPLPFMVPALAQSREGVRREFHEAVGRAVKRLAGR